MIFDSKDIQKQIKIFINNKLKNKEIYIPNYFYLLRISFNNHCNLQSNIWDNIKFELKQQIRFNFLFDYLHIKDIYTNTILTGYNIKTISKNHIIDFNTLLFNDNNIKIALNNDFNNYLNQVLNNNQHSDNNQYCDNISDFHIPNFVCLFVNKEIHSLYNLEHIYDKTESKMLANILSNIINFNLT